jgi:hypothetical protein
MNQTSRFVNMSGLNNVNLTGSGNTFTGSAPSGAICYYLPNTGSISLGGDKIEASINSTTTYVENITQAQKLGGIVMPYLLAGNPQVLYSGLTLIGEKGFLGSPLSAEPTTKVTNAVVLANGVSWDPLTLASGRAYYVMWQGDRWRAISG